MHYEIKEGYYLYNETLKIVHKCDDKCQNCSFESTQNNLCISCNEKNGYYPLLNDSSNINSFINCYNNLFGYYLLNKAYVLDKRCDSYEKWNFNLNNNNYNNSSLTYFHCNFFYYCDSSNNSSFLILYLIL